jgi:hypothetical protein
MTDATYSRQQARADKRAVFKALRALDHGDTGPADRLTSEPSEMTRRSFLVTSASAVTVAPALPAPAVPQSFPAAACLPTSIYRPPQYFRYRSNGKHIPLGGGGDWFEGRGECIAAMRAKEGK